MFKIERRSYSRTVPDCLKLDYSSFTWIYLFYFRFMIILSLIKPIKIPTKIGKREISICEGEMRNIRKSILPMYPIIYNNIIVPNELINGNQKGLLINL